MSQLPYTLTLRRIYILPTRFGYLFILLLMAMLVGSVNYNNNLGFLLSFLLIGMGFVSIIHTYRNISGVKIVSVRVTPVFAKETAVFEFLVRADGKSRASMKLGFSHEKGMTREPLLKDKDNRVHVSKRTYRRGILKPGVLNISTNYPLGLFRAWSRLLLDIECPVYPRPIAGWFKSSTGGAKPLEDEGEPSPGVDDFQGLSNYQPGDSLQHISWKAFSKGQGLLVKKFEGQTGSAVFFDWETLRDVDIERKLSLLCGMILRADKLNITYGLRLPGFTIEPGSSERHKHQCLKALAVFGLNSDDA